MLEPCLGCLHWGSKHPAGRHRQLPAAGSVRGDNRRLPHHSHLENNFHVCSQKQSLLCGQGLCCLLLHLFSFFPSILFLFLLLSFPLFLYPSPLSPLTVFLSSLLSLFRVVPVHPPCRPAPTPARGPAMPLLALSMRLWHPFGHLPASLASHSSCHHLSLCDSDNLLPPPSFSLT